MKTVLFTILLVGVLAVSWAAYPVGWTWEAPTLNTDGSPLTDLAGYELGCGDVSGTYPDTVDVGNVLTYMDDGTLVPAGSSRICAVRAYDTSGNFSVWSSDDGGSDFLAPVAPVNLQKN